MTLACLDTFGAACGDFDKSFTLETSNGIPHLFCDLNGYGEIPAVAEGARVDLIDTLGKSMEDNKKEKLSTPTNNQI